MNDALGSLLQFAGRLHPIILHVPIGLLFGLVFFEVIGALRKKPVSREVAAWLVWPTAAFTVAAAATGYQLHLEGANTGWMVERHLQLGIALALVTVIMALAHAVARNPVYYRIGLLLAISLLIPTGHLGGSMTHGERFLIEPFTAVHAAVPSDRGETAADVFSVRIAPMLEARCVGCHGQSRQKGGLALHTLAAMIQGGDGGAVFVPGEVERSEIIRRLRLPIDHDDHMPPEGKPQLAPEQIEALEQWIARGASNASFVMVDESVGADSTAEPAVRPPRAMSAETRRALTALDEHFVHYEALAEDEKLLAVSFAAVAGRTDDAMARRLLEPLLPWLASVSLERCAVGDATVAMLSRAPNLLHMNLSQTNITNQAVAALAALKSMRELVITQTALDVVAVEHIATMPALERVYLWGAGIDGDAVAWLRAARPELYVDDGTLPDGEAMEAEPDLEFTSDRPLPGQRPESVSLRPINSVCPVSGRPIDPGYSIVYKGQVIAFCCGDCALKFWTSPESFAVVAR